MKKFFWIMVLLALALPVAAVETSVWQVATFQDFLRGKFQGVSLSQFGSISLGPREQTVFNPNEALVLSLAKGGDGTIYLGTGHQGKVFRVDANGKGALFFTAPEPDVFALAVGPDGDLYVGTSPNGKIYRVSPNGKSSVFYEPGAKYIWALAFGSDGKLYAGTGDRGKIFQINPNGSGRVFFESHQTHIMCLAFDHQGRLLAGSAPNGLIYRINPSGKGFVLYQAALSEIHALAVGPRDQIYAAALSGPGLTAIPNVLGAPAPAGVMHTQTGVVMTAMAEAIAQEKAGHPSQTQKKPVQSPSFNRPSPSAEAQPMPFTPSRGQGALLEVNPDSTVDTLWRSAQQSIFGLALRGPDILFSTSDRGRIYDLRPSKDGGKLTLVTETHESLATRILLARGGLYVATSNIGKLIRLGPAGAPEGTYVSSVKDTRFISHWGELTWRGRTPGGASIEFYTRSGNFGRPDATWSGWSGPYTDANGSTIKSPPARYLQWKAVLRGGKGDQPTLDEVSIAYLNQNMPPEIQSLNVSTSEDRDSPLGPMGQNGMPPGVPFGVAPAQQSFHFGPPPAAQQNPAKVPVTLSWQAGDPDGDPLVYSVYVKAVGQKDWHLLKSHLHQTSLTIAPNSLADGQYVAKLVASDSDANPPALARASNMLSAPFWIDNTPPTVTAVDESAQGASGEARFSVTDPVSPLHGAEVSLDFQRWHPILSTEGIVDSQTETFVAKFDHLKPGEHVITLRAYDTAGNVGVGSAVIEIPAHAR